MKWRWLLLFFAVLSSCLHSVLPQCDYFDLVFPPTVEILNGIDGGPGTLVIPGGSENPTTLYCAYNRSFGIGVNWHKDTSVISDSELLEEECGCTTRGNRPGVELLFTNFRTESEGQYGCWATDRDGQAQCNFDIMVAEPPTISLGQNDVTPTNLETTFTISPQVTFGVPSAAIVWSRNGVTLDPETDPRVSITGEGALVVTNMQSGDRGVYTVTASNTGGSANASVNVTVCFVELMEPTVFVMNGNRMVTCTAASFPSAATLTLIPDLFTGSVSKQFPGPFQFIINNTYTLSNAACDSGDSGAQRFECKAEAQCEGSSELIKVFMPCESVDPPLAVMAANVSTRSIRVSWVPPLTSVGGYRIQYYAENDMTNTMFINFIPSGTTQFVVENLRPGITYVFRVGSLVSETSDTPQYAPSVQKGLPPCSADPLVEQVTGVNARLASHAGRRTITITWNGLDGVSQYLLSILRLGGELSQPHIEFLSGTSFTLPTDWCNGTTYQFTVSPTNICGSSGPMATVQQRCSVSTGNPVTLNIASDQGTTFLQLRLITTVTPVDQPVFINATTITPSETGTITISRFTVDPFPPDGLICIGDLTGGTLYNVCVDTSFVNGDGVVICVQGTTSRGGEAAMPEGCWSALNEVTQTVQMTSAGSFPDWAIAVIVVGVLALVAVLFCLIGLCFACNNSSSKDYDIGSVSSLQTASIPPGPGVPPYMPNHRPVSPNRSCLSYRRGHNIDWNEHRNTLQQMDTETGTHV